VLCWQNQSGCPCSAFALRGHQTDDDALQESYNEGRLAFRRYFAKYGPNVRQNDPRMPPMGFAFAWLDGFESELRRHVPFIPSAGGFRDIEERLAFVERA
jgi:hypothetical protein